MFIAIFFFSKQHVLYQFKLIYKRVTITYNSGQRASLVAQQRICLPCRRPGLDPWVGKMRLENGIATHFSTLAWRIPWAEEPGGLQSIGWQRVGHDRATNTHHM